jgi:CheY-like chemotaxis protein
MAIRILVVDDDESMRVTLEACLDEYAVQVVASGREAQAWIAKAEFDLVLCDLMMPEMTGAELYESLAEDSPLRDAFVFISGGSWPRHIESFVAEASPRLLNKPFTVANLREVVAAVLSEQAARNA